MQDLVVDKFDDDCVVSVAQGVLCGLVISIEVASHFALVCSSWLGSARLERLVASDSV